MNVELLDKLKVAVAKYPHEFVGVIPFSKDIIGDFDRESKNYIPYGSTLFTNLAYDNGWTGLHFDLSTFNYETALQNRADMLNDNIDTIENHLNALSYQDANMELFIRPSEDLKKFSGQIMKVGEMYEWLQDAITCVSSGTYKLEMDTKILVCQPKNIQAEWRWFIVGGKIIDGSMYRHKGQMYKKHETDADVIAEAQLLADMWLPDMCVVMDTALVNDEVKVIEFNCINSSGFYDHDINKIIDAIWKYHANN